MWSGPNDVLVTPRQLYELAWSKPMRDIAADVGMSDVGLAKNFRSLGIPLPPRGYWAKKAAGRAPEPPKPPARRPGEWGQVSVSGWLADHFRDAPAPDLSPDGPFASELVPEDLEELRLQTLRAIGRVTVPRLETRTHAAIAALLKKDAAITATDPGPYSFMTRHPTYNSPFERRRLRLLNALLLTLQERDCRVSSRGHEELELTVTVGKYSLNLTLDARGVQVDRSRWSLRADPPRATTPLLLTVAGPFESANWEDRAGTPLEKQLADVAAGIIVLGELSFRRGVAHRLEVREQHRKWAEERRCEEEARREQERVAVLEEGAASMRKVEEIRALVVAVVEAAKLGECNVPPEQLERWRIWALQHADRLDPLLTGKLFQSFPEAPEP